MEEQHPLEALKAMLMGLTAKPWVIEINGQPSSSVVGDDEVSEALARYNRRNGL